jgi:acyl-CoA synthetase (AMP-forming)/AMP-acid ligase II
MPSRDEVVAQLTAPGAPFEVRTVEVAGARRREYAAAPPSLRAVLEATAVFGDRPFLVYGDERWTFAEHLALVGGLARRFRERDGVRHGDRIAIAARNYPEWAMTFWAAQAIGAVAVPLNAWWTGPELAYALRDAAPVVLVCDDERLARVLPELAGLDVHTVMAVRTAGDLPTGVERWEDVLAGLARGPLPAAEIGPDDLATILYTSGTTGQPKGAVGTHRNHCTNITNSAFLGAVAAGLAPAPAATEASAAPVRQPASLQVFPFFHIGGLSGLCAATAFGSKLVTMYKWDTDEAIDILEREEITGTAVVPTLLRALLDSPRFDPARVPALGGLSSGGAPVPPDLIRGLGERFARKVSPANGYGLTETTSAVVINTGADYLDHPDSIGRPVPVAELRVVGPDGMDAPAGGIGELWVRGANVVAGYWNKPEATAAAFTDGWFHTGDLGYVADDGFVYVVDRLKDVVLRGGENVYCAEVEAVLFEHPAVLDVAVVGVPHASLGEEVAAVVNVRPGAAVTAEELRDLCMARLARFKAPTIVVFRPEPLPRTATGKVLKRELRDELTAAR